jgi:hypothetical protein
MRVKAARGSAKNITPNRLSTTSNAARSSGCTWASPCTNVTLVRPASSVRRRASASSGAEMSSPTTCPSTAARAAARVETPAPQPTSSTRSAGAIAAAVNSHGSKRALAAS